MVGLNRPIQWHQWNVGALIDSQITDYKVKNEIENLLTRKIAGDELKEEPKIKILNDFLEKKIKYYNDYLKLLSQRNQPEKH